MSISPARYHTVVVALLVVAVVLGFSSKAAAQVNGAIYTTSLDGKRVNQNIYGTREAVYLSGGPQNQNSGGLSPDGRYYFQVTDPSGAVLLSTDPIECREVVVTGGRITGVAEVPIACLHRLGDFNSSNDQQPVQLSPFNETPNRGGEYKVWLTPVGNYSPAPNAPACSNNNSNITFGFCAADSKTDNFKVRDPKAAYVTVCKFHDQNGSGQQDEGEPLIPHWPITATGVDGGTVRTATEDSGCVSFAFSGFTRGVQSRTITLTEGTQGTDWTQTAPADGTYGDSVVVAGGVITVVLSAGDNVDAPNFGNVRDGDVLKPLVITATASTSFDRAFTWTISKAVDQTRILTANGSATFTYTVSVNHDTGTDSRWQATGTIRVSNPNLSVDIDGVTVVWTTTNGGTCTVVNGDDIIVTKNSHFDVPYTCTYGSLPVAGTGSATATWSTETASASAAIDFADATMTATDGEVEVTDTLVAGVLFKVDHQAANPFLFTYPITFDNQTAGTCTGHNNTATFTTNTSRAEDSASQSVDVCVGANLTVEASAAADFAAAISKAVNKTRVQQAGGSSTFGYTVQVTEHGWMVSGNVTVTNPNDWQDIAGVTLNVGTTASCIVNGGEAILTVNRKLSVTVPYTCTFAAAPSANAGLTSASITWDDATAATPESSASTSTAFTFPVLTVTDTFNGVTSTLGTVTAAMGGATFPYSKTVANATAGACLAYVNTASITGTIQSAGQTVYMCNTATGAHTIGFWQNKNGQAILTGGATTSSVCNAATWLRNYLPFQDLAATSNCKELAVYAMGVIKAANASGASMNKMLKAQMLATAFDVYYSTPGLGDNKTGAPVALGGVMIDLTNLSGGFGGATSLSVLQMLAFAAGESNVGGTLWYGNVKTTQEFAKNAFDDVNNARAYIAIILP